jgi:hypothetical protein
MKYAAETGSGVVTYVPNYIHIGSAIQNLTGDIQTQRLHGDLMSLLSFYFSK